MISREINHVAQPGRRHRICSSRISRGEDMRLLGRLVLGVFLVCVIGSSASAKTQDGPARRAYLRHRFLGEPIPARYRAAVARMLKKYPPPTFVKKVTKRGRGTTPTLTMDPNGKLEIRQNGVIIGHQG